MLQECYQCNARSHFPIVDEKGESQVSVSSANVLRI
jgi:hypothetical protein